MLTQEHISLGYEATYGPSTRAALVPWRYAWPDLNSPPLAPSNRPTNRDDMDLVLVNWHPTSDPTGKWVTATAQLSSDPPELYQTTYDAQRIKDLTRLKWPTFFDLFRRYHDQPDWHFYVQTTLLTASGQPTRLLWYQAETLKWNRVVGSLAPLSEHPDAPRHLDTYPEAISSFHIKNPLVDVDPTNLPELTDMLVQTMDDQGT